MSEIKYEAVFGPQELFNSASDDAVLAIKNTTSRRIHFFTNKGWIKSGLKHERYIGTSDNEIAMRSIIKTQVWTVADQKAGRLPEVGCKAIGLYDQVVTVTSVDIRNGLLTVQDENDQCISIYRFSDLKPIETPAEKAKRLRSEWVKHALDLYMSSPKNDVASMGDVYDALLSGELQVPKGE